MAKAKTPASVKHTGARQLAVEEHAELLQPLEPRSGLAV